MHGRIAGARGGRFAGRRRHSRGCGRCSQRSLGRHLIVAVVVFTTTIVQRDAHLNAARFDVADRRRRQLLWRQRVGQRGRLADSQRLEAEARVAGPNDVPLVYAMKSAEKFESTRGKLASDRFRSLAFPPRSIVFAFKTLKRGSFIAARIVISERNLFAL